MLEWGSLGGGGCGREGGRGNGAAWVGGCWVKGGQKGVFTVAHTVKIVRRCCGTICGVVRCGCGGAGVVDESWGTCGVHGRLGVRVGVLLMLRCAVQG